MPEDGRFASVAGNPGDTPWRANADDVARLVDDCVAALDLRAVHEPELDVTGRAVVPHDHRFASVASRPGNTPRCSDANDVTCLVDDAIAAPDLRAVHEPELDVVGRTVVPEDIQIGGDVHLAGSDNAPRRANKGSRTVFVEHGRPPRDAFATHEPELGLVGRTVVPDNIGVSGAIQVAGSDGAPRRADQCSGAIFVNHRRATCNALAAHEPDLSLVARAVVPDDLGASGGIHAADSDDAPGRAHQCGGTILVHHGRPTRNAFAVHEPDLRFVGRTVVPDDRGASGDVHIACSDDAPRRANKSSSTVFVENGCATRNAFAVHEPDLRFVGRTVVPDDRGASGDVHVACSDDAPRRANKGSSTLFVNHGRPARNLPTVHEPELGLAARTVVPDDRLANGIWIVRIGSGDDRCPRVDDVELVLKQQEWIGRVACEVAVDPGECGGPGCHNGIDAESELTEQINDE